MENHEIQNSSEVTIISKASVDEILNPILNDEKSESQAFILSSPSVIVQSKSKTELLNQTSNVSNCLLENGEIPENSQEEISKVPKGWRRYIGILLAIFCSIILPLSGLIVKMLPEYHPFSIAVWRFQGILLPAIPTTIYYRCIKKQKIFDTLLPLSDPSRRKAVAFLVLRCAAGATAAVLMFSALHYISVADTTVIMFSAPVFVTFAAHFFLGESIGILQIVAGVCALIGIVIITRPPIFTGEAFHNDVLIGTGCAFGGLLLSTIVFVVVRHLRNVHVTVLNLAFGTWGTLESLACALCIWAFQFPEGRNHWLLAGGMAVITCVYQTAMVLSLKHEQAGTVSLIRTCDVIFAFFWQFAILRTIPDIYSGIGALIVVFGMVLVGFRKWVNELHEDDPRKIRLHWVLK